MEIVFYFWRLSCHGFLFSFTLLVALKLDHLLSGSWWFVFTPLWWLCHAVISRGRFSLPTPPMPHDEDWAPFQYVMATPLFLAFEILLFVYLEDKYVVDLKLIFLPLLAFEVAILVYNFSACFILRPRDEETLSCEPLLYTWVSIWMVSFISALTFTLVKSRGDVAALDWWDFSINLSITECFGFLVSTKLNNQSSHSSSSVRVIYGDQHSNRECSFLDIGGYVMKIPFIIFQFILLMGLEGTPASPKNIPIVVMFVPLFLIQGATVLFVTFISVAMSFSWIYSVGGPYGKSFARLLARVFLRLYQSCKRFVEKSVLLICSVGRYFATSTARIFLRIFQYCKRLLGCWSVDEEQSRLYTGEATGYNTFSPEVVKKTPESDLVDEVCRLKAALSEKTDNSQQEKNLCKVCFEDPVNVVLIPCRHHVLCSTCCKKCKTCPICRVLITHRMPVYNV